ncbi:hypothetical protein C7H84_29755 [Burkholderia sp. Nafp2/4-1b]|uniref:hypothetical protein n=1 Tax=Burkholderia sp. Nafp2/4-1b TaxID=2116686 RepID=UPI000EF8A05F|nr:hypothetical protein [Burkholderia sp. Nafp2/4-1b]RKT99768.1 hypothetical protein C7H84_29755 [Burkholderia sp. Nafp2/4-1b]
MSLTRFLIRTLARVDDDVARRVMSTASAQDDANAPVPAEFARGRNAMAYALAMFIGRRPLHFYVGLFGLVAFPAYLTCRAMAPLLAPIGGSHGG